MKPHSIGRALGAGLRVAGRIAAQRLAGDAAPAPSAAPSVSAPLSALPEHQTATRASSLRAPQRASRPVAGSLRRGLAGLLRPLGRAGGILWLELTGSFFFLFALLFAHGLWLVRAQATAGPEHGKFLADAALMAVFLYLGVTSFWRARRR